MLQINNRYKVKTIVLALFLGVLILFPFVTVVAASQSESFARVDQQYVSTVPVFVPDAPERHTVPVTPKLPSNNFFFERPLSKSTDIAPSENRIELQTTREAAKDIDAQRAVDIYLSNMYLENILSYEQKELARQAIFESLKKGELQLSTVLGGTVVRVKLSPEDFSAEARFVRAFADYVGSQQLSFSASGQSLAEVSELTASSGTVSFDSFDVRFFAGELVTSPASPAASETFSSTGTRKSPVVPVFGRLMISSPPTTYVPTTIGWANELGSSIATAAQGIVEKAKQSFDREEVAFTVGASKILIDPEKTQNLQQDRGRDSYRVVDRVVLDHKLAATDTLMRPSATLHPFLRWFFCKKYVTQERLEHYEKVRQKMINIYLRAKAGKGLIRYKGRVGSAYLPFLDEGGGSYELVKAL